MTAYYNEYDAKAAAWLRELIKAGLIAPGEVDERSIIDVKADELRGFTQCHFFAGIGGWSYALRLAGWPDNIPVWTGSCPCQSFSTAGKGAGFADERHLWPAWFWLISQCRPGIIFGEQVEAAINHGWLDLVSSDLEGQNYHFGSVGLPACGIGAPHIRQRIWFVAERWVADSESNGDLRESKPKHGEIAGQEGNDLHKYIGASGLSCGLADTASDRCQRQGQRWQVEKGREPQPGIDRQLSAGLERSGDNSTTNAPETFWSNPDWLYCRDGKWRPVESEVQRVVDGLSDELVRSCNIRSASYPLAKNQEARVMRLKGYGNAIAAPLAAEFIKVYLAMCDATLAAERGE